MLSLQRGEGHRQTDNRIRITTKDRKDVSICLVVFFCVVRRLFKGDSKWSFFCEKGKEIFIMCTAATYKTKDFYFGRTLDYDFSYGDDVVVMPRNYPLHFRCMGTMKRHYAMIGMAYMVNDDALFYDATNEKGLGMAGLNFVGNAVYSSEMVRNKNNVAQFELIPWILSQCATIKEVRSLLENVNLTDMPYSKELPPAQLHWIIADRDEAITMECVKEGLRVHDNLVGILTNNPPFEQQMFQLNNYMYLSPTQPKNNFCSALPLSTYSRGMGAMGLPGDLSSESRFVRAAFTRMNSVCESDSEEESVSQFFHILGSVDQQRGCCDVGDGKYEVTLYTSCCNADRGIYYYTSYDNHQISAVDMHREDLEGRCIIHYPLIHGEQILWQN